MTTLTLTAQHVCGSNNHIRLSVSDGQASRTIVVSADEIAEPLDEDRIRDAVGTILKLYARGRTRAQVRSALVAGLEVVL